MASPDDVLVLELLLVELQLAGAVPVQEPARSSCDARPARDPACYGSCVSFDVVVAADLDWGIGKQAGLPWPKLRGDLAHFRRLTTTATDGRRNAIVMGRRTWESTEVAGKPLPKRLNIVVSRRALEVPEGVIAVTSLDDALRAATAPDLETIFVVGGAEIYQLAFEHPALRYIYLTRVDGHFECDTTIPDLDARGFVPDAWDGTRAEVDNDNDTHYRIERLAK